MRADVTDDWGLTCDTSRITYHRVTHVDADERTGTPSEDAEGASEGRVEKKERVLHTRVPAVLERELKRFADNLRVPVSNLVRAILQDALTVADAAGTSIEERLKNAAKTLEQERERLKKRVQPDPFAGVVAFQWVTLAQPAACAKCERSIPRGAGAHLGLTDGLRSGPNLILCEACLAPNEKQ
jgi:exonuclease VII large subunit